MGQIVGGSAKTKRCNLNKLSQLGTPAAGEHILVSSNNSMNAAGQGNFDCYIVGDGSHAATALELKNVETLIGVFDISSYHATGGVLAKYADLTAALNDGNNIPQSFRKGGMSVKFVQSSDNKYVQYRLMAISFSTTEADWQGVDEEPIVGSKNLVDSDGVAMSIEDQLAKIVELDRDVNGVTFVQPMSTDAIVGNLLSGGDWYNNDNLRSLIINVEKYVGMYITAVAPASYTEQYAFLYDYVAGGVSTFAPNCSRQTAYPSNVRIPEGTHYLYLLCGYTSSSNIYIPRIFIATKEDIKSHLEKVEDRVFGELQQPTIDSLLVGNISSDGMFVDDSRFLTSIVPIKEKFHGKKITVTINSASGDIHQYAFLQSFNKNGYSAFCEGCQKEDTYPTEVTIPNDCAYLYLYVPKHQTQINYIPVVEIIDADYDKGLEAKYDEQIADIEEQINTNSLAITALEENVGKDISSINYNHNEEVGELNYLVNGEKYDYVTEDSIIPGNLYADGSFSLGLGNTSSLILRINKQSRGKRITVNGTLDARNRQYAFLKDFNRYGISNFCEDCSRESTYPNNVTIPSDCNYIYLLVRVGGDVTLPTAITIENAADSLVSKVNTFDSRITGVENEGNFIVNDILKLEYLLKGVETSRITFRQPIVLSQDGDSLEFIATPYTTGDGGYSFGKKGNSEYYSIALSTTMLKIRNDSNTSLLDIVPESGDVKVKIEYADGGMKFYVNDILKQSYETQSTISLGSIGNSGAAQYGYWSGIIKYIKQNGSQVNLLQQELSNVDIMQVDKQEKYPTCVVDWDLEKFTVYTRIDSTEYYAMLEMKHVVDHSELQYVDMWRLYTGGGIFIYKNDLFVSLNLPILASAENEFAFKYTHTSDFTGGYHGDERIDIDEKCYADFYIDGIKLTSTELSSSFTKICNNFELRQLSTLHETSLDGETPVANHPIIAYHYKDTMIHNGGFKCFNRLDFDLSNSNFSSISTSIIFTGLICIHKNAATIVESDTGENVEMTGSNNTTSFNGSDKKKTVTLVYKGYNPTKKLSVTAISKEITPNTALSQFLSVWDRSTDSKYYGYAANKTFNNGDIYCAEHSAYWDLYRENE